jgi:Dihydroprymidine dehydrogenase domain II, 4Fe-4S cluster/NAD(P)-binding Rossmann-like domain
MSVRGTRIPPHLQLPIAGVTPPPTEKEGQRLFPTGNFRFFRPVYKDKTPPCNNACPTGEQIQKYLDFVKHERYLTIMEDNPMPSVTGRVCYHPCETACNRAEHDEPIGIRSVERFLGDYGLNLPENPILESLPPLNGTTIAIVGSGPAGLAAAYHLRRRGYPSVIFEALDKPGGMLRAGIPHWHLPEEILDAEIAKVLSLGGIEIHCNVRAGVDITWDELRNYPAAFLALGQDVGRRLPVGGPRPAGSPAAWSSSARPGWAARCRPAARCWSSAAATPPRTRPAPRCGSAAARPRSCPWKPRTSCRSCPRIWRRPGTRA